MATTTRRRRTPTSARTRSTSCRTGAAFNEPGSDAAKDALRSAQALDPPDATADDWQVLIEGSRALVDVDPDDPAALEDLPPEVPQMGAASANVFRFLDDECGLDVSGGGDTTTTAG